MSTDVHAAAAGQVWRLSNRQGLKRFVFIRSVQFLDANNARSWGVNKRAGWYAIAIRCDENGVIDVSAPNVAISVDEHDGALKRYEFIRAAKART